MCAREDRYRGGVGVRLHRREAAAGGGVWKQRVKRLLFLGVPVPGFLRPLFGGGYHVGVWIVEGLAFIRKVIWVEPVLRSVCRSVGPGLRAERLPYMRGRGELQLGARVYLSGQSCFYFVGNASPPPLIEIGDDVFIGNACTLSVTRRIVIGSHCLIAPGVRIHDNDGHPINVALRLAKAPPSSEDAQPVVIGRNVWVGAGSLILKGVSIGDNTVIGASSVVTSSVPGNTIVAGNPAKVIRELTPAELA